MAERNYPVFATQGGGLARSGPGDSFIFIETPKWGNYQVGDLVPEEWSLVPINKAAREEVVSEDFAF